MASTPSLAAVLAAREARAQRQSRLLSDASAVVSLTVVAPGPVKQSPWIERAFAAAATSLSVELVRQGWDAVGRAEAHLPTGPELQVAVRASASSLKASMIRLEEGHPWGRLWDLDVVTEAGPISRTTSGSPPRRCLVCSEPAAGCARSRRHDPVDVDAAVERIMQGGSGPVVNGAPARIGIGAADDTVALHARAIGALAAEALRTEARLAPKPGLVDVHNTGAHSDMTLQHFLASADALQPWFAAMAELGGRPGWRVADLQGLGRDAERAMLAATAGVNTHRGGIYALGWLSAVAGGASSADDPDPAPPPKHAGAAEADPGPLAELTAAERLATRVGALATPLLSAWLTADHPEASHGRDAYLQYNLLGARGEAAAGFGLVMRHALPRYRAALSQGWAGDDALLAALVTLMARLDDTNLVSRGGLASLRSVQGWARELDANQPDPDALRAALTGADTSFSERRWSPGGSADLLSATWFLAQLEAAAAASGVRPGAGRGRPEWYD